MVFSLMTQSAFILNSSIKYVLISEKLSGKMKIEKKKILFLFVVIIIVYPFQFYFIHFQISSDLLSSN